MAEEILELQVLAELLAHIPAGARVEDLDKKLLQILNDESEDSLLRTNFPVHSTYRDSPELSGALVRFRMSGSLITLGPDCDVYEIRGGIHVFADVHRDEMPEGDRKYLAEKAELIEY